MIPKEELARLTLKVVVSRTIRSRSLTFHESTRRPSQALASPVSIVDKTRSNSDAIQSQTNRPVEERNAARRQSTSKSFISGNPTGDTLPPTQKGPSSVSEAKGRQDAPTGSEDRNPPNSSSLHLHGGNTGSDQNGQSHDFGKSAQIPAELSPLVNLGSSQPHFSEEPMELDQEGQNHNDDSNTEAPTKPPPVPPRPLEKSTRAEYEEFAQQQDVQEVIENVLYLLRWAVKAESEEPDGEQIDLISR